MADFGRDHREHPAPRRITCEDELYPVREPLSSVTRTRHVRSAQSKRTASERQGEAFRFQRLGEAVTKAVPQQRDERLSARVDPQALMPEGRHPALAQQSAGRQLTEQRVTDEETQARIAPGHWMADAIAFTAVEK